MELKREIRGRDETVQCKEKEITELKKDLRATEKHSFVLNHKIKLLEDEILPKENKISEMKSQILAMEEELTNVVRDQAEFNVQMTEAKSKLTNAVADVTLERRKVLQQASQINETDQQIYRYKNPLFWDNTLLQASQISKLQKELAALHSQDPKKAAAVLGTKFVPGETGEVDTESDSSTQNEVVRQKDYLEKTVLSLKSQLSQVEQQNKSNNLKMFRENKELLREIARLKKEILDLKQFRVKII